MKTVLFDGAMGTYLASKYDIDIQNIEFENIMHPERVLETHKAYIAAGADAIKTNTFNAAALCRDKAHIESIITAACEIAREAILGTNAEIYASIGQIYEERDEEKYEIIIKSFISEGVEKFLFETFLNSETLCRAAEIAKNLSSNAFVIGDCSIMPDGYTRTGISAQKAINDMSKTDAIDVCGFNCSCGPRHMLQLVKNIRTGRKPLCIMPNAGYPDIRHNHAAFQASPEYFAQILGEIHKSGIYYLGGCCGTTPEHIKALRKVLDNIRVTEQRPILSLQPKADVSIARQAKKAVIAVELDSPMDANIELFLKRAKSLTDGGADLLTIADCPVGRARMDSSLLAAKLKRDFNIDCMPHLTCRDRNLNATKALLLGLHAEGVRQVLLVTGDPLPTGSRDEIKSVFNFNSVKFASYLNDLNQSVFSKNPFKICAAININAVNFNHELDKSRRKEEAGVTEFFTQPVLSETAIENLQKAKTALSSGIMAGIMPIVSYKNAVFIKNEISGITISDDLLTKYEQVSPGEAALLAVEISAEMAEKVAPISDGYYIITTLNKVAIVRDIIKIIKHKGIV
ncbi:MAG: bifunctional homocysteine S-methyltransferase/methylenetetrahydrofolate reductase [Clostridiales bacterium]|jgi:homocysteine S-methyltransferase|nr:bifunctional homocysteine S-methyltransferase/methylenetetrahydrofolate reductase [Clostridiales bacterium]